MSTNHKISLKEKIGYALGDAAANIDEGELRPFSSYFIQMYLV